MRTVWAETQNVVIELKKKFVQYCVPVSLRKRFQRLWRWVVLHHLFRFELFFFPWVEKFLFVESHISGQNDLVELGDPNTVDIAGVVANKVSDVPPWAKLELVDISTSLVAVVEWICLATIGVDSVPFWS